MAATRTIRMALRLHVRCRVLSQSFLFQVTSIEVSRSVGEQQLGHPVRTFADPVGKPEHIGEEGLQAVKEAGYRWALTTIEEVNDPQADPYLLRRLPGDLAQHWLVMASELAGLLGVVSRLRIKYRAWTRSFGRSGSNSTNFHKRPIPG